eukprot:1165772-Amphidinium_carterae.1
MLLFLLAPRRLTPALPVGQRELSVSVLFPFLIYDIELQVSPQTWISVESTRSQTTPCATPTQFVHIAAMGSAP